MRYSFKHFLIDFKNSKTLFINNWIRSILSAFGIIIGVASIILIISVSEYAKNQSINNFKDIGLDTIRIINKDISSISKQHNLSAGLSFEDFNFIKRIIDINGITTPIYKNNNITALYKNKDFSTTLFGTNPFFIDIEDLDIISGRGFIQQDITNFHTYCIISSDIAKKYGINISDHITILNQLFTVIGISSTKDKLSNFITIPYSVYPIYKNKLDEISCSIKNQNLIFEKANTIKNKLQNLHKKVDDYEIVIPILMLEKERNTQRIFSIVVLSIAIVSLLTGGISIMNIMLSNISEQTREIGLRLAIGATKKRILIQYFINTYFLTFLSGIVGIIIGYIAILIISMLTNINFGFSFNAFVSAALMTIFSGIIFGIYPAIRASQIEPIIALKEI